MSTTTEIAALVAAAVPLLGGGGYFVARATVRAARVTAQADEAIARLNAAPQAKAQDFAVLQATVARVDEENGQLRGKQARLEALLRAFSWTVDRWAGQMHRANIDPEPVHPLVDEYNRTGV
ncbi:MULTISPECIES: hypothetical protein [Streptomyces]|uniref:hypothetical protein n=1 Tax=Streptomyces TaxID=1883 RepID=UPI0005B984F6|nr:MULTISPECIES: hypothetical protein [Streptomyces]MDP9953188.1 hypothetical protein [Streptomyces sp. DSM 41269]